MLDYRIVIVVSSGCNWNLRCLAQVFLSPTAEVINLPSHKPATAPIADWHRNTLDVRYPAEKQDGWFLCFKRMLSIKQKKTNVVMSSESINYWSKTQQLHAQTHIVRNNPASDRCNCTFQIDLGIHGCKVVGSGFNPTKTRKNGATNMGHCPSFCGRFRWTKIRGKRLLQPRQKTSNLEVSMRKQAVGRLFFSWRLLWSLFFSVSFSSFPTLILAILKPPQVPNQSHLLSEVLRHAVCSKSWYQIQILWKNNLTHGEFQSKTP